MLLDNSKRSMADNIHETIAKASKELMYSEPFYGMFLLGLNKVINNSIPTAGVSKQNINCQLAINESYWNGLTIPHRVGLMKHELLHIVFHHLSMRDGYSDHFLFNIAADCEINQYIKPEQLPPGAILPSTFPELNLPAFAGTKYYYDAMHKDLKQNGGPGLSGALQDIMDSQSQYGDSHSTWKDFDELTEAEKELIKKQVDYQLKEVANSTKDRNQIPGELKGYIDKLFETLPPVFDWKGYLRRFVGGAYQIYTKKTRRKLNKRFPGMPALKIKPKVHILVAVDTSGSVSDKDLMEFFSEITHMYKTGVTIDIAQCDSQIDDLSTFKGKFDGRIHGRGGTNFEEPVKLFNKEKKYATLIYLTDGYAPVPSTKPRAQMMWVLSPNGLTVNDANKQGFPGVKIKITHN
jgi:predicted metal-dependent peptidase